MYSGYTRSTTSREQVDAKGRVNSLTTVLVQEVDRYNKLLRVIIVCYAQLYLAQSYTALS